MGYRNHKETTDARRENMIFQFKSLLEIMKSRIDTEKRAVSTAFSGSHDLKEPRIYSIPVDDFPGLA